jgi:hypothetical protein
MWVWPWAFWDPRINISDNMRLNMRIIFKHPFPTSQKTNCISMSTVFWVGMPFISERDRGFGGTFRLHLHDRRVSLTKNRHRYEKMLRCFMFGLLFDPEEGSDIVHRIIGLFPKWIALQTRKPYTEQWLPWEPPRLRLYSNEQSVIVVKGKNRFLLWESYEI